MPETLARDKTLGQIDKAARLTYIEEVSGRDSDAVSEAGALAVRDAVMAHVINKIRLYSMLNAKSASAMEYSKGLQDYLCQASSEDDEAHHRFALHPVAAEDA